MLKMFGKILHMNFKIVPSKMADKSFFTTSAICILNKMVYRIENEKVKVE